MRQFELLHEEDGLVIHAQQVPGGAFVIHLQVTAHLRRHWRRRRALLALLPVPSFAVHPREDEKHRRFMERLGARFVQYRWASSGVVRVWRLA